MENIRLKNSKHPLFTIITVSFNSESTIRKTIESVLNQTYLNIEYLIIDGASSDNTVELAKGYESRFEDRGITYRIISEPDLGLYDAMNKGIRLASGEIIGIINSDDWYAEDAVKTAATAYSKHNYDYFFADVILVKPDGMRVVKHSKSDTFVTSRHWNHPSSFVTKKLYEEMGPFRNKGIHDDFDFYLRVRSSGKKIVIKNKVIAYFRTGGKSNDKSISKAIRRIRDRYRCYTENGYSPLYIVECVIIEVAKWIIV